MRVQGASGVIEQRIRLPLRIICFLAMILATGCGTTKSRIATEQLLMSDAVDHAISEIDFSAMSGQKVFFDSRYINNVKGVGFVNAEYIISSLRQQMLAADCRLQDEAEDADFIVEARVGALGTNGHEIVYGLPANSGLSAAADFVPNSPGLPAIPELALAKKDANLGAAKVAAFAYDRESRRPVWQSGISKAKSTAQDFWLFGAGPFQRGTVYDGTQFAGSRIRIPQVHRDGTSPEELPVSYAEQFYFPRSIAPRPSSEVGVVGYEQRLPPVVLAPTRPPGSEPNTQPPAQPPETQPIPASAPTQVPPASTSPP
ncbi:MAG: hypothetical protein H6822_11210 [Planctomycetaceae bacterium]|nr:hypothetical protein [Planctomycetaceae bacterium]